jgi:hypothetical protein
MKKQAAFAPFILLIVVLVLVGCAKSQPPFASGGLTDQDIENLVRQSYRFVAMYNVNNKFALKQGGWNTVEADTELKDHTMREIARPNNDTLYIGCMLDLRAEPVILEIPAFDSDYASLMITGYDHYVNVPMTTRNDDFEQPEKMLVYSARTAGYDGGEIEGVDRYYEATGDFVSAVFRIMPHASDPARFAEIVDRMQNVRLATLSEYLGGEARQSDDPGFPPVGRTDFDVFESNLLEVMQFVFNHTDLDPEDEVDRGVLAAYEPLGVVPGRSFDRAKVASIDGAKVRQVAERIWAEEMAKVGNPEFDERYTLAMFQPKGNISAEVLLFQSVLGPIGLPAVEAVYPAIAAADGEPMNAMHDYVIRMTADEMPPAGAFWSVTLYDTENGFFVPNDRKKYSVGANAGMQLDKNGGIAIYIAAEKPDGVPEENWLPINREDIGIGPIMRLYEPDLERFATWEAPKAEKL